MTGRAWLALLRPHAAPLGLAGALLAITGLAPGAAVWLLRRALDAVSRGELAAMAPAAAAFVALTLLQAGAGVLRAGITRRVSGEIASDLRRRLHAAFLADRTGAAIGDRVAALADEVDQVQYGVSAMVTATRNPLAVAGLLGVAVAMAPQVAGPAVVALAVALACGGLVARPVRRATEAARRARAGLVGLVAEHLAGAEVLRSHGAVPGEVARLAGLDDADRRARWRLDVVRTLPAAAVTSVAATGLAGVLAAGAPAVRAGALAPADLVTVVAAVLLASRPLADLAEVWSLVSRSRAALARVEGALAAPAPARGDAAAPTPPVALVWDRVRVERGGRRILDDVSARVSPGELVAVVGPSGAGKTTLLRVCAGGVALDGGEVRVGGILAADLGHEALGRTLAVVPQDGVLFARSVADNVALGGAVDPERVAEALRAAAAGFVSGWPDGADTVLGERGAGLSGGERQRLAIARAVYRAAPVLLLDEPTASLDAASAATILATLRAQASAGRAVVVATHDPAVVRACDRAIVLRDGRVVDGDAVGEAAWTGSSAR